MSSIESVKRLDNSAQEYSGFFSVDTEYKFFRMLTQLNLDAVVAFHEQLRRRVMVVK